jgi:hypothetical protein
VEPASEAVAKSTTAPQSRFALAVVQRSVISYPSMNTLFPCRFLKTLLGLSILAAFCLAPSLARAQGGLMGGGKGPQLNGALAKLFGEHKAFSANMDIEAQSGDNADAITMPAKVSFLEGKSRFDLDVTQAKGAKIPPATVAQFRAMGMAEMILISRPDKKLAYLIYPGLQSYALNPLSDEESAGSDDFKVETSELGKETVDGHPCIKNKVTVTNAKGTKREFTVCNATDLKKFPVQIQTNDQGVAAKLTFKDIKFDKPQVKVFEAPTEFTKYDSMQAMMQQAMMKRFGAGGGGTPPPKQ